MKRAVVAVLVLLALAVLAGAAYWYFSPPFHPHTEPAPPAAGAQNKPEPKPQPQPQPPKSQPEPAVAASDFCDRDFHNAAARKKDVPALTKAGGLVYIFEREARLSDPYGCAAFYLAHGLNIDAVDPRAGHGRLTALDFAIKRNDTKMLHFMIDHGADLKKKATVKHIEPMGYAYLMAFSDDRINRNAVISILNDALEARAAAQPSSAPASDAGASR